MASSAGDALSSLGKNESYLCANKSAGGGMATRAELPKEHPRRELLQEKGTGRGHRVHSSDHVREGQHGRAPYLKMVDIKMYSSYEDLSMALEKMFSCFITDYMPLQPLEDENDTVISFLYPLEPPVKQGRTRRGRFQSQSGQLFAVALFDS
ncbi:hypothetical protein ZEAMMB73_Zm00001d047595 [Zea mays]|uniref:Auxin-responsive protein n=2 Tax=Zea mays TaxID=4577 RepID=A0A1D6PBR5_MAIZE|nr:hypothetical protein ZEAMMB73_Zm00001d047595 [Zea mays]